jgi:phosphonate transport system ATP-binding protein
MIRVEDLEVVYPNGTRGLAPTNLIFQSGVFTVFLGASGAGKSTLLRALNGLVTPTRGRVLIDGIGALSGNRNIRTHRRHTGMVFQQHQLIPRASVLTNVLTGRLGYHSSLRTLLPFSATEKRLALEAIGRVGLIDYALRRADQLSGGQQQRVGIARALVQEPTFILADEPVASLDPASADRVLGLLHGICKADGISAIVSLHQLEFARRYADRIVALSQGRVVFDGAPRELGKREVLHIYRETSVEADDVPEPDLQLKTGTHA